MSTKPGNKVMFKSDTHGRVTLVKRSVGFYEWKKPDGTIFPYWRGQLAHDWSGHVDETGEVWFFSKGELIWLNAKIFKFQNSNEPTY